MWKMMKYEANKRVARSFNWGHNQLHGQYSVSATDFMLIGGLETYEDEIREENQGKENE